MNRVNMLRYQAQYPIRRAINFAIILLFLTGCEDEPLEEPLSENGKIVFTFEHLIDGEPVLFDTLMYTNEAGNPYLVNEIQYFISDVTLFHQNDDPILIEAWKDKHYVDTDLPETHRWEVYDDIPPGVYDSVHFRFGIAEAKNISFMYPNPPERDMFWPEYLGGGYHYMKLNGKWLPAAQVLQTVPFDFHMGIGQVYYQDTDSITGFIHNDFIVSLKNSGFTISKGEKKKCTVTMNVDKWFKEPHLYDHDVYGGYIMQNQEAMEKAKENGHNVFTFAVF